MSDHVLGEFPDLTPDHLRHTFVKPHNCPGLAACTKHPRWIVHRNPDRKWVTVPPNSLRYDSEAPTHTEAIDYAQKQARKATR